MDQLKRLSKAGRDEPMIAYKALKTHAAKRQFAQKLMIDREAAFLEASETHWAEDVEREQHVGGWYYIWDVARVNGIQWSPDNVGVNAVLQSMVAGCPTKPPDDEALKEAGWVLYKYSKFLGEQSETKKGKKVSATATAKVDEPNEFGEIVRSIHGETTKASADAQAPKAPKQKSSKEVDAKQLFLKWEKTARSELQKFVAKATTLETQLPKYKKEAWCGPKIINTVCKVRAQIEAMNTRILKFVALHQFANATVFEGKRFKTLQGEVDKTIADCKDQKHIIAVASNMVSQMS